MEAAQWPRSTNCTEIPDWKRRFLGHSASWACSHACGCTVRGPTRTGSRESVPHTREAVPLCGRSSRQAAAFRGAKPETEAGQSASAVGTKKGASSRGHPVPGGHIYGELALQVGGVSNGTGRYGRKFCGLWQGPEAIARVH
jgi:hypothetical protein